MKKTILATFAIVSLNVNALDLEDCKSIEMLSTVIMKSRQNNVPMSKIIDVSIAHGNIEAIKPVIIDAYNQPVFATENYKHQAISKFSNKWFLECYKVVGGAKK